MLESLVEFIPIMGLTGIFAWILFIFWLLVVRDMPKEFEWGYFPTATPEEVKAGEEEHRKTIDMVKKIAESRRRKAS